MSNYEEERNKCLERLTLTTNGKIRCRIFFELINWEVRLERPEEAVKYLREAISNGLDASYIDELKVPATYRHLENVPEFHSLLASLEGSQPQGPSLIYAKGERERCVTESLICPLCNDPYYEPLMHLACCNLFCTACIASLPTCPQCQGSLSRDNLIKAVPVMIANKLDALKCHCPRCQKTIERSALKAHVEQCPLVCPDGCKQRIPPSDLADHKNTCPAVEVSCTAADVQCPWQGPRRELSYHTRTCKFVKQQAFLQRLIVLETNYAAKVVELEESNKALAARVALLEGAALQVVL